MKTFASAISTLLGVSGLFLQSFWLGGTLSLPKTVIAVCVILQVIAIITTAIAYKSVRAVVIQLLVTSFLTVTLICVFSIFGINAYPDFFTVGKIPKGATAIVCLLISYKLIGKYD